MEPVRAQHTPLHRREHQLVHADADRSTRAIGQTAILMAVDNAVDHDRLQGYFGASSYATALSPYLSMERYSIHGLVGAG